MLIVFVSLGEAVEVLKCHSSNNFYYFLANSFSVGTLNSVHMYIWTQIEGLYLLEYTTWFVYLHMIFFFF